MRTTLEAANRILREHYMADFNRCFQVTPEQAGSAFVAYRKADLDDIFCLPWQRTVNRDNTVSFENLHLQIKPVRWRGALAGCTVTVHQHLDATLSLATLNPTPDIALATKSGHFNLLTTCDRD